MVYLPTKGIRNTFFLSRTEQLRVYEALASLSGRRARDGRIIQVIVKLHRDEDLKVLRQELPNHVWRKLLIVQHESLYPLLVSAHVAVSSGSTAGLEALLFGLPLVMLDFSGRPEFYDFAGSRAASRPSPLCQLR